MTLTLKALSQRDIEELTPIMKDAFDYDTKLHLAREEGGPEGYDNGEFLRKWALNENSTSYCIYLDDILVGGIILWINDSDENYLGNLFIKKEYQNKGVGTKLWRQIEGLYPYTKKWSTETPLYSRRNLNFYVNKCGFHVIKVEKAESLEEGFYILQKLMV